MEGIELKINDLNKTAIIATCTVVFFVLVGVCCANLLLQYVVGGFLYDITQSFKCLDLMYTVTIPFHAAASVTLVFIFSFPLLKLPITKSQAISKMENLRDIFATCTDPQT